MRRTLGKLAIALGIVVLTTVGWLAAARSVSMLVDRIHTRDVEEKWITGVLIDDADPHMIRIDEVTVDTATPQNKPFPITMSEDEADHFRVTVGTKSIILGSVTRSDRENGNTVIRPENGDRATLTASRSLISWPVFELNLMTGQSPSSKRHFYYRLLWQKSNGPKLEMVWRYLQYFYARDGWTNSFMTEENDSGLVKATIDSTTQ